MNNNNFCSRNLVPPPTATAVILTSNLTPNLPLFIRLLAGLSQKDSQRELNEPVF